MTYQIFKNTYRIPVKLRDKLELPSLYTICKHIESSCADSRACILSTRDDEEATKKWDTLKSISLLILAPFPYVLVEQYEFDKTDLATHFVFVAEKDVGDISNVDSRTCEDWDRIISEIKYDRDINEIAEKNKLEGINNGKRRR